MLPILNDTYGPQIPESSARKIFDSIVRIEVDKYKATGFFLRIKIRDRQLYCLVTNDHVIPKEYVTLKKVIFLFYGKKENEIIKKIRLDSSERFIRCFCKPKDITVVEIKNYDYIHEYKFLEPDLDYKSGYNQYLYKKYYLAGYPAVEQYHQDPLFVEVACGVLEQLLFNQSIEYYGVNSLHLTVYRSLTSQKILTCGRA